MSAADEVSRVRAVDRVRRLADALEREEHYDGQGVLL